MLMRMRNARRNMREGINWGALVGVRAPKRVDRLHMLKRSEWLESSRIDTLKRMRLTHAILFAFFVLGFGCGGPASPVDQCTQMVSSFCEHVTACGSYFMTQGDRASQQSECERLSFTALPCGKATGVTAGYGQCRSDIDKLNCTGIQERIASTGGQSIARPDSCTGVIEYPKEQ